MKGVLYTLNSLKLKENGNRKKMVNLSAFNNVFVFIPKALLYINTIQILRYTIYNNIENNYKITFYLLSRWFYYIECFVY